MRPGSVADGVPASRRKPRRPPEGGFTRGEETRARIIAAALDVFGAHGFDAASTRMLADRAGVNLPALQYYFEGKQGLYLACAEHVATHLEGRLGPAAESIARTLASEQLAREQLFRLLHDFLDKFEDLFLGERQLEKWVLFIIREQAHPTEAFDIIYDRVMRRVVGACAALVGRLLEQPADDPTILVRTVALLGQIIFFRTAREAALRTLGWPDFDGERLPLVKNALNQQITAALGGFERAPRRRKS